MTLLKHPRVRAIARDHAIRAGPVPPSRRRHAHDGRLAGSTGETSP